VMDAGGQSPWASLAAVCLDARLMGVDTLLMMR